MKKIILLIFVLFSIIIFNITPVYALGPSTNYSFPEYMGFEAFESALGFANSTSYKLSGLPTSGNPQILAGAEITRIGLDRNYYYRDISWTSTTNGGLNGIVINVGFKYALSDFNISVLSDTYSMNNTAVILPYRDMSDSSFPYHYVIIISVYSFTGWVTSLPNFMRVTSTIPDNQMGTPYVRYFGSLITQTLSTTYEWQRSYSALISANNSESYQEQYNNGYNEGHNDGLIDGKYLYGMLHYGDFYTAEQWGIIQYQNGINSNTGDNPLAVLFGGLSSLLGVGFAFILQLGTIELLGISLNMILGIGLLLVGILAILGLIFGGK